MDARPPESRRTELDSGAENAPELRACHYRARHDDGFRCEAAFGIVDADNCRACSIPEAVAHHDACLYLVPLRDQGEPRYACKWFFSGASEPVMDDWRKLCFCPYWFPRGCDESFLVEYMADTRARYLRVLHGEEPRRKARELPSGERLPSEPSASPFDQWWRSLLRGLSARHE
jgi:hypothetical protein